MYLNTFVCLLPSPSLAIWPRCPCGDGKESAFVASGAEFRLNVSSFVHQATFILGKSSALNLFSSHFLLGKDIVFLFYVSH